MHVSFRRSSSYLLLFHNVLVSHPSTPILSGWNCKGSAGQFIATRTISLSFGPPVESAEQDTMGWGARGVLVSYTSSSSAHG